MQFIIEEVSAEQNDQITTFYSFVREKLGIYDNPIITFAPHLGTTSFGLYTPSQESVSVATEGRHISDILRTFAHELVHHAQLTMGSELPLEGLEYEANAVAGMLMRDYNKLHPEMFGLSSDVEAPGTLGDSQGAVASDTTRPSQPVGMSEDAGAVTAGSGDIAGLGVGPQGEPGFTKKNRTNMLKRRTFKQFRKSMLKYS